MNDILILTKFWILPPEYFFSVARIVLTEG